MTSALPQIDLTQLSFVLWARQQFGTPLPDGWSYTDLLWIFLLRQQHPDAESPNASPNAFGQAWVEAFPALLGNPWIPAQKAARDRAIAKLIGQGIAIPYYLYVCQGCAMATYWSTLPGVPGEGACGLPVLFPNPQGLASYEPPAAGASPEQVLAWTLAMLPYALPLPPVMPHTNADPFAGIGADGMGPNSFGNWVGHLHTGNEYDLLGGFPGADGDEVIADPRLSLGEVFRFAEQNVLGIRGGRWYKKAVAK